MDDLAREAYSVLEDLVSNEEGLRVTPKIGRLLGEMKATINFANLLRELMRKFTENEKELIIPEDEEAGKAFLLVVLDTLRERSKLIRDIYNYMGKHLDRTIRLFEEVDKELKKNCGKCDVRKRIEIARNLWFMWSKMFLEEVERYMDKLNDVVDKVSKGLEEGLERNRSRGSLWKKVFKI